jgi:hypothetical protein
LRVASLRNRRASDVPIVFELEKSSSPKEVTGESDSLRRNNRAPLADKFLCTEKQICKRLLSGPCGREMKSRAVSCPAPRCVTISSEHHTENRASGTMHSGAAGGR